MPNVRSFVHRHPALATLAFGLVPVAVYLSTMAHAWRRAEGIELGRLDRLIFVGCLAYLVLLIILILRKRGAAQLVLGVYAAFFALVGTEFVLRTLVLPPVPGDLPWPPGVRHVVGLDEPGLAGVAFFSTNSIGLRGPEVRLDRAELRILCVGGSTTECLYVTDAESWPWRLGTCLTEVLGKRVFVGNAGKSGHFSLHHEYLLRQYLYAGRFDWVVVQCGINDAGTFLRDHYALRAQSVPEETLTETYRRAAPYRRLALVRLLSQLASRWMPTSQVVQDEAGAWYDEMRGRRREGLERNPIGKLPEGLDEAVATYRANLRRIAQLCRERGQRLVLVTQPTLWSADLPETDRPMLWQHVEGGAHSLDVLATVIDAYNAAMIEVANEQKVPCLDLARLLPKDSSVLYDDCHFNRAGSARVAELLCEFLSGMMTID